jgi:uncharacterized protein GlcG (DUF336 family)
MINLKDARQVIAAAEAKAHELGQPMNIAVVDAGGNLVSHVRMDGVRIGSIDVAHSTFRPPSSPRTASRASSSTESRTLTMGGS